MKNEQRRKIEAELMPVIAAAMKEWRKKNGLTQEKMAQKLLVDVRTYFNLESGVAIPSTATFTIFLSLLDNYDKFMSELCQIIKREEYDE